MDLSSVSFATKKYNNGLLLKQVTALLKNGSLYQIRRFIHDLYPAETAHLYFTRSRLRIFQIAGILGLKVF
ncbi:MAG: hypothetical protein ISR72_02770 [Methylobacter sp.]|nr:hypothetical protein [Methylobacter sp.]